VGERTPNTVSVINTATNLVIATIPVGTNPEGLAIRPDGAFVYVANNGSGDVSVINTTTNTVTATVSLGPNPIDIAVLPDGTIAYVTIAGADQVIAFDTATNSITSTFGVGTSPFGIAARPTGGFVYVANQASDDVSILQGITFLGSIPVGDNPIDVAVSADGRVAYVTNASGDTLSVINLITNTVTATIPVPTGTSPHGLVLTTFLLPPQSIAVSGKAKRDDFLVETDHFIQLNWSIPLDGAIPILYKIYRDGTHIASLPAGDFRSYKDHNLKRKRTYTYQVIAEDSLGPAAAGSVSLKAK